MSPRRGPTLPLAGHLVQLGGVVAAVVLAFVVNVLGDRHFTRWDWTRDKRWSLSPATVETLHSLEQPVEVWAITGAGDSLQQSIKELLASYQAASSRIEVHTIDPDRDVAQLVALQARFGLEAGRTEDGRVATDAVIVVATGDKHWFLTPQDLYEQSDDVHVKPREERALTRAIRSVLGGEKAKLCFTAGHGEMSLEPDHDDREGLGALRDLFEKNNYELATVDTTVPGAHEPFAGCSVVLIAGMRAPFAPEETTRLRTWLLEGGSLLAAVGPLDPTAGASATPAGLDDALAPFGIALEDDVVEDLEPSVSIPETHGQGFFVSAHPHPVTTTLVAGGPASHPPRVAAFYTRSMRAMASPGAVAASALLTTSDDAFAKRDVAAAAQGADAPPRSPSDASGPFVIAMASERPRASDATAHGPRVVVLGSRYFLAQDNWRQPRPLHGAAFLVDSALSWLAARPEVVDVPDRAEVAAGMRVSEEGRTEVQRYVLYFMPLAALLLGAAVWAWRRSSENKPYTASVTGGTKEPPA
ncbi:MAG: GldG family protein [Polyangiaceae bacterium]